MSNKRYPEVFKIEAVRQVTDHGYSVADMAGRLDVQSIVCVCLAEEVWL